MSESNNNNNNHPAYHIPPHAVPTIYDLHREQSRQAALISNVAEDISEIKAVLVGRDKREGLVMDVDRLKRTRTLFHAVIWVVFTSVVGTCATVVGSMFK